MKTIVKKFLQVGLAVSAIGVTATTAMAGAHRDLAVVANPSGRNAYGFLGTARNSADGNQQLGCSAYAYSTGPTYGSCYAVDAAGTYVSCTTTNPALVSIAASLPSDGYLYFMFDASGNCTYIDAESRSSTPPKAF